MWPLPRRRRQAPESSPLGGGRHLGSSPQEAAGIARAFYGLGLRDHRLSWWGTLGFGR